MGVSTGRVFQESTDIYQDQARVLFDYYRQAAEKIVSEEVAIEGKVEELGKQKDEVKGRLDGYSQKYLLWGVVAGVCLVATFFFAPAVFGTIIGAYMIFKTHKAKAADEESVEQIDKSIEGLASEKKAIRRDYKVERIGVAYVPVARRVAHGNRSYVVDVTGSVPQTDFSLTVVNKPDELKKVMEELHEHMTSMPIVESNYDAEVVDTSDYSSSMQDVTLHDYMGSIDRQVRNARRLISDNQSVSMSLPVVSPDSNTYSILDRYSTMDASGHPVISVFDESEVDKKVEQFSGLGEINRQSAEDGSGNVDFFVEVMRELANGVDVLSRSRAASISQLVEYSSDLFSTVLKSGYDQYSPRLEAEEIERIRQETFSYGGEDDYRPFKLKESSRVRYDIFEGTWVSEDGGRTAMPYSIHQVDAEVLMPTIENLMQENRIERLRIYREVQAQKTSYLNKWHQDTNDFYGRNRAEGDELIQRMHETYADFQESYTNYEQQKKTFNAMKLSGHLGSAEVGEANNDEELIAGFNQQAISANAKQEEFRQYMDRIQEDIDESAKKFGHVEFYEASLRDSQARENARALDAVREVQGRRRRLAHASAYLAQHGIVPPEPRVTDLLDQDYAINLSQHVEHEVDMLFGGEGVGTASNSEEESDQNMATAPSRGEDPSGTTSEVDE